MMCSCPSLLGSTLSFCTKQSRHQSCSGIFFAFLQEIGCSLQFCSPDIFCSTWADMNIFCHKKEAGNIFFSFLEMPWGEQLHILHSQTTCSESNKQTPAVLSSGKTNTMCARNRENLVHQSISPFTLWNENLRQMHFYSCCQLCVFPHFILDRIKPHSLVAVTGKSYQKCCHAVFSDEPEQRQQRLENWNLKVKLSLIRTLPLTDFICEDHFWRPDIFFVKSFCELWLFECGTGRTEEPNQDNWLVPLLWNKMPFEQSLVWLSCSPSCFNIQCSILHHMWGKTVKHRFCLLTHMKESWQGHSHPHTNMMWTILKKTGAEKDTWNWTTRKTKQAEAGNNTSAHNPEYNGVPSFPQTSEQEPEGGWDRRNSNSLVWRSKGASRRGKVWAKTVFCSEWNEGVSGWCDQFPVLYCQCGFCESAAPGCERPTVEWLPILSHILVYLAIYLLEMGTAKARALHKLCYGLVCVSSHMSVYLFLVWLCLGCVHRHWNLW